MSLRGWLHERGIWWHAQNLDRDGRGSMWREGRTWIRVERDGENVRLEINPAWHILGSYRSAGFGLRLGEGLKLWLGLYFATFWLTIAPAPRLLLERLLPSRVYEYNGETWRSFLAREIDVSTHGGAVWWSLWTPPDEWSSRTPRWRHGNFSPVDFLLGQRQYHSETLEERTVQVALPERTYEAKVRLHEDTWQRPRWPFPLRVMRATIDVDGGIPTPGKGENAWDCGEDATYGLTAPARSINHAIGQLVASVTETRLRYGGQGWRPERAAAS